MVGRLDKRAAEEREQSGFLAVDAESDKRGRHLRRGWYWGKQAFAENLLKLGEAVIGRKRSARGYDASPEMKAHGKQQALALLEEGLRVATPPKEDLIGQGCTEPRKVLLAGLLWKKTTVSQAWIAEHLGMKNAANVSRVIHRMDLSQLQEKVSGKLRRFVSEKMQEHEHCPLVYEDLSGGYSFHEGFGVPFQPSSAPTPKTPRTRRRETKALQG